MLEKIITENELSLTNLLSELIEKVANEAIKEKNIFLVGLSGGSLIKYLAAGLPNIKTDFTKWVLFFCDERIVPENNSDSTYGAYKNELIGKIPLTEDQFVKIKQGVPAEEAAKDYCEKLFNYFPENEIPKFDMLLLGMGPDGHTCSLFPGHVLLNETSMYVAAINDSPKPPPSRITLTYPVINNAKYCIFALTGEGKADMVKRILVENENLPAGRVKPTNGKLYWILDKAAAKFIS